MAPPREAIAHAHVIVDALLGTGFSGVAHEAVAEAIEAIDAAPGLVVSVDMPSGVDAEQRSCRRPGDHSRQRTVTFHAAKPGLWIYPGKGHAGEIDTIDIGIPRGAPGASDIGLIRDDVLDTLPSREAGSTKFSSGHVIVVGGSRGLMGAPAMASLAALRAGAGYVTACVPQSLQQILDVQLLEVMTLGLADEGGALTPEGLSAVKDSLARAGCSGARPGLGRNPQSVCFARELAHEASLALVLDADGLNAHAGSLAGLAAREAPTVLTPHAGELARLLGLDSEQVRGSGLHTRARPPSRPGRSSCSRATTHLSSSRPAASRSAAATVPRLPQPAPGTCSPARLRRCSRRGWNRLPQPRPASSCTLGQAARLPVGRDRPRGRSPAT